MNRTYVWAYFETAAHFGPHFHPNPYGEGRDEGQGENW